MDDSQKLAWTAPEYEHKTRSRDWFWALGVIVITTTLASIIFENYFFAFLILLGGALLGFYARKHPDTIAYEITEAGVKIASRIYPYEKIKSFWVQGAPSMLFIKTERVYLPVIYIPLPPSHAEEVHQIFMYKNIPEEEMREHASEKIMESLGF